MAVIKKNSSGRSFQFIDEEGNVFQTSTALVSKLLNGTIQGDFVVVTRLPIPVPVGKFPVSPVWGSDNSEIQSKVQAAVDSAGGNAFSKDFLQERKEQKASKVASVVKGNW